MVEAVAVGLDEEATLYGRGAEEHDHRTGNYPGAGPEDLGREAETYRGDEAGTFSREAGAYRREGLDYGRTGDNGRPGGRHAANQRS